MDNGGSRRNRRRSTIGMLLASVLAIGGVSFALAPAATAAESTSSTGQTAEHPAYPYDITFVWELHGTSVPGDSFHEPQTLVASGTDPYDPAFVPAYTQTCDTYFQIDHYRITNDADQATVDTFNETGELPSPIDATIGKNWSKKYSGKQYWSYTPSGPAGLLDCATPVAPAVTQAVCTEAGDTTAPTLTLPVTTGIAYSSTGEIAAGKTVTVGATPSKGYALTEADGWTINDDGTAQTKVTFETVDCTTTTEVTPIAPQVTPSVCTSQGLPSAPALALAETAGIRYDVTGEVAVGETVVVTATPEAGSTLAETAGWKLNADGTATFETTFEAPECATTPVPPTPTPPTPSATVEPVQPSIIEAACTETGTPSAPTLTVATTTGITYQTVGAIAAGETVAVTATPQSGYTLAATPGWTANADGSATTQAEFATAPTCEKPTPGPLPSENKAAGNTNTETKPALAATGTQNVAPLALGALALLTLGAVSVIAARRRRAGSL